jgi:DeoR family fructose operon transcriptional repressor
MIHAARKIIFCLDHTKFGRPSISFLCTLDVIDTIVTDPAAPPDMVRDLRKQKIEVVIADKT